MIASITALVIGMSWLVGRRQKTSPTTTWEEKHPLLAGRRIAGANQISAISLVRRTGLFALKTGGGLRWLQYELAIPLAMLFIISFLLPAYSRLGGATIYEYLEHRFGKISRVRAGFVFLLSRSLGAGVVLLATSYVAGVFLGFELRITILLIAMVALIYTVCRRDKGGHLHDLLQLVVLWLSSAACIVVLAVLLGGTARSPVGSRANLDIRVRSHRLGDGETFSFWPMLFGGSSFIFVLRLRPEPGPAPARGGRRGGRAKGPRLQRARALPGRTDLLRVGVLMIPFLARTPDFAETLRSLPPDYLMPHFFTRYLPAGLLGFVVAGMLAASMSSLDSAINSLSAVTWEDFARRLYPRLDSMSDRGKLISSRLITLFWGCFSTAFALHIAGGSETVIELVNKIGSAFYGPVAGVFALGIFTRRARETHAMVGFAAGFGLNILLWMFFESSVSWMWWNLGGFALTLATGSWDQSSHQRTAPSRRPERTRRRSSPRGNRTPPRMVHRHRRVLRARRARPVGPHRGLSPARA